MIRKDYLKRLTYNKAESLYYSGHLAQIEWEWFCWLFGQTSEYILLNEKGKPEPKESDFS